MFPNPAKEQVLIRSSLPGELTFILFDATGHEILKKSFYQSTELRTDKLLKSVYFYRISNDQRTLSGKLIIESTQSLLLTLRHCQLSSVFNRTINASYATDLLNRTYS
ncbi:T9SS type A sorting domain-containing protein [Spirosoma gilvum]